MRHSCLASRAGRSKPRCLHPILCLHQHLVYTLFTNIQHLSKVRPKLKTHLLYDPMEQVFGPLCILTFCCGWLQMNEFEAYGLWSLWANKGIELLTLHVSNLESITLYNCKDLNPWFSKPWLAQLTAHDITERSEHKHTHLTGALSDDFLAFGIKVDEYGPKQSCCTTMIKRNILLQEVLATFLLAPEPFYGEGLTQKRYRSSYSWTTCIQNLCINCNLS